MKILEWETELWLFGKDKDSIISQHAISKIMMPMFLRMYSIQMILKAFGHLFTIHTIRMKTELKLLLNMEVVIFKKLIIKSFINQLNILDSFWEVQM